MSRQIVVGDVHGCYFTLQALLQQIPLQPEDTVIFLGDLIGKGPYSERVLEQVYTTPQFDTILGNHEVSWIRHCFYEKADGRDEFEELLAYEQAQEWLSYLITRPFLIKGQHAIIVHAAIDHTWDWPMAQNISNHLSECLRQDPDSFFESLRPPQKNSWSDSLSEGEKRYLALQILTRARFYQEDGVLDLNCTDAPEQRPDLTPWYQMPRKIQDSICFGHWAALSARPLSRDYHLDGGAVYGGQLVAMDLASKDRWTQNRVLEDGQ